MPNFILAPHHAAGNGRRAISGFRNPGISLAVPKRLQPTLSELLHVGVVSKYQFGPPTKQNLETPKIHQNPIGSNLQNFIFPAASEGISAKCWARKAQNLSRRDGFVSASEVCFYPSQSEVITPIFGSSNHPFLANCTINTWRFP